MENILLEITESLKSNLTEKMVADLLTVEVAVHSITALYECTLLLQCTSALYYCTVAVHSTAAVTNVLFQHP